MINLGGNLANLIFHTQKIIEWSLKQSDMTPAFRILSGCDTRIQSSNDCVLGVIRVGSLISWVRFILLNNFLSLSADLSNQFLLKSPSKINSLLPEMELMVEIMELKDTAGDEGGLYMLPIVRHLFT